MIIIYITFPTLEEAKKCGALLVQQKLAACVNIFPITSMYLWENALQDQEEFVMLVKTKRLHFEKIKQEVASSHSYANPAIYAWDVDAVAKEYGNWLDSQLK